MTGVSAFDPSRPPLARGGVPCLYAARAFALCCFNSLERTQHNLVLTPMYCLMINYHVVSNVKSISPPIKQPECKKLCIRPPKNQEPHRQPTPSPCKERAGERSIQRAMPHHTQAHPSTYEQHSHKPLKRACQRSNKHSPYPL